MREGCAGCVNGRLMLEWFFDNMCKDIPEWMLTNMKKWVNKKDDNWPGRECNKVMEIWYTNDDTIEWHGKNLKPSEITLMASTLQEHALRMVQEGFCQDCGHVGGECQCPDEVK